MGVIGTLTGTLLKLHLTEAEGHANGDATTVELRVVRGLHVWAIVALAPTVPVKNIVSVDKDRHLAVEEIRLQPSIDAITSMPLVEEILRR